MTKRVVVAMSGGVDSSVAAWLLKQRGYEVIGLFMRTGVQVAVCDAEGLTEGNGNSHAPARRKAKGCCSSLDAADARRVAEILEVPFYALDFAHEFGRIMDYFADEYLAGRTPNPCVMCNNWLKFGRLWGLGRQLAADYIATGHYARIIQGEAGPELHTAVDPAKDQSYVLAGIRRQLLERILFPVGEFTKARIRELAQEAGLPVHNKPDSQEICFVPDGDYAAFVKRHRPDRDTAGVMVDTSGRVLAHHDGIERFTIGQRKGLGLAVGQRRYVLAIVPATNTVVVGTREECLSAGLLAERFNWLIPEPAQPIRCSVKIRYRTPAVPATVHALAHQQVRIVFDEPQLAVTPGQAAVCYEGTRVLGGGWIERALSDTQP